MNKFLLQILLFLSCFCFAEGTTTTITGNIKGLENGRYNGKPFNIAIIQDFITNTPEEIASSNTDNFGNFKITFNNTKVNFAILRFGKIERYLFVQPGKSYFVEVRANIKKLTNSNGFFAKDTRYAYIKNAIPGELNYQIDSLDRVCSDFLARSVTERKIYKSVKAFTDSVQSAFSDYNNTYFQEYLNYKVAEMQMFVLRTFRKDFIDKHLTGRTGYASNIQSMHVINSFFKGHLKLNILSDDNSPFHKAMLGSDLSGMLREIHPYTSSNKELNELILMKGISEIANVYYYRKSKLTKALDLIIEKTNLPLHKTIARNIKLVINHLEVGSPAPNIQIVYENTNFNLKDYKGKYVYLCFFRGWDSNFEKEMEVINYLRERYEDDLEVVCIATDIDKTSYDTFLGKQQETNHIFHYNYDAQLLMDYRIKDFRVLKAGAEPPAKYLLIGPQGDIVYNDAKSPTAGFEYDLRLLIGK